MNTYMYTCIHTHTQHILKQLKQTHTHTHKQTHTTTYPITRPLKCRVFFSNGRLLFCIERIDTVSIASLMWRGHFRNNLNLNEYPLTSTSQKKQLSILSTRKCI